MADLIYDNGLAGNANNFRDGMAADDFVLDTATILSEIIWIGVYGYDADYNYFVPTDEEALIQIYPSVNGAPGPSPLLYYWSSDVSRTPAEGMAAWDAYQWTAAIPDTELPAGTYYLSVRNSRFTNPPDWDPWDPTPWYWGMSSLSGNAYDYHGGWVQDTSYPHEFRFAINGTIVPEPKTTLLLMLGALAILYRTTSNKAVEGTAPR